MIYRRRTYKVKPEMIETFNRFFHQYLLPNQLRHGAKLVGRWVNEERNEIVAMWKYASYEEYERIEQSIRKSDLHKEAQTKRAELGQLFLKTKQDFLTSTGTYHDPMQIVSVAAYITNEKEEVLLVKNHHRSDTYEIPGGQVEEGESLLEAAHREVMEETGVTIKLNGITGIYQNVTRGIICVVFRGEYVSGDPRIAEGETKEVFFQDINSTNVHEYVTRPHFKTRVVDAMNPQYLPCEIYHVNPFELIERFGTIQEKC